MFKKIELWIVVLLCIFVVIFTILYGALLRHHYIGGQRFQTLQKVTVFFAEIPNNIKNINFRKTKGGKIIIENKSDTPSVLSRHKDKPRFKRYISSDREVLLVLPRYDGNLLRSVVEIIDLNTFEVLHTYKHDINSMNNLIDPTKKENERVKIDHAEIRFAYQHPLITKNFEMISIGSDVIFKTDFCSNLIWINQEERFHHSIMLDSNENIWVGSQMFPYSDLISNYINDYGFRDDAIAKINQKGQILFIKSVIEILIENKIKGENILQIYDSIHLNDIEPTFNDTEYWKKGDLFISMRHQPAIIHYRPTTNKIINYIKGPFYQQHDVDVISDKEISIFNNNPPVENSKYSEVLIYNFETKTFSKKFNKQLQQNDFKTISDGLADILNDGSMLVEEQNYGRLIFFNKDGEKEWEFVNKDDKGNIYVLSWSRIIEDKNLISKLKEKIKNTTCLN